MPEIDLVQVQLEDALLRQGLLDPHRQDRLARLAGERHLVVQQHVLGDLLGDGRGADRPPPLAHMRQVEHRRRGRSPADRRRGWVQKFWSSAETKACFTTSGNRRIRHEDAPLGGKFRHQPGVAGVDPAHHRRLIIAQPIDVRQIGAETLPRDIAADAADRGHQQADGEEAAHHAAHEAAEQAAARLARPAAAAARGSCDRPAADWRQLFAGCQGFAHGRAIWAIFDAADQRRER